MATPSSVLRSASRQGFTFAEALAALVFVSVVIPVALQGVLIASRLGEVSERRRQAAVLADRMLSELAVTGEWQNPETQGDFGDDWPGYRWTLETPDWTEAGMVLITVTVFYTVQTKEYSVRMSTLVEEGA